MLVLLIGLNYAPLNRQPIANTAYAIAIVQKEETGSDGITARAANSPIIAITSEMIKSTV